MKQEKISTRYYEWLYNQGYSQNTIETYSRHFNFLRETLGSEPLNQENVDAYIAGRNYTVARAALKSYLEYLFLKGNKAAKSIHIPRYRGRKEKKLEAEILTEEEVYDMAKAFLQEGAKDYALIVIIGYETGLRISEILNIEPEDVKVNEERGDYFIVGVGKGRRHFRQTISEDLKDGLIDYMDGKTKNEPLFDKMRQTVYGKIRKAGMDLFGKKISPHTLRHSFVTHLLSKGFRMEEVKSLARHEKIASTEIYTHIDKGVLREKLKKVLNK